MKQTAKSIFDRERLGPNQMRTVADRRFGEAEALLKTKRNVRANGAMYMSGFRVECLLKAKLLEKHHWLQSAGSQDGLQEDKRDLWRLVYRSHDLELLCAQLPDLTDRLKLVEQRGQPRLSQKLKHICATWTIFARYSTQTASIPEAEEFLADIKELSQWLR